MCSYQIKVKKEIKYHQALKVIQVNLENECVCLTVFILDSWIPLRVFSERVSLCVADWLFECTVQKLVLVITCLETHEVLERWQFDIECDKSAKESRSAALNGWNRI